MSTSIGELSVGVSLDLAPMEKDAKKMKAQLRQLDKEAAKMGFREGAIGSSGFGGGYGKSLGKGSRGDRQLDRGGFGGGVGAGVMLAKQFGGQALGKMTGGGGGALMNAMPALAGGAAVKMMTDFKLAVSNFAKESGKLDDASLSVIRYGESLTSIGKTVKETAMGFAVEALGTLNKFGEFIGSGFDMGAVNAANASERAASQQEQRRDALFAANDPKQVAAVRERIKNFQRETAFNNASAKQQQNILRGEISALAAKEKQARESRKILEAETLKEERLRKEEELRKNIEAFTAKQRANEEAITAARMSRQDEQEKERKANEQAEWQKTEDALAGAEREVAEGVKNEKRRGIGNSLDRVREQMASVRNPFSGPVAIGYGTASPDAVSAMRAKEFGDRAAQQQIQALGRLEDILFDILAAMR